MFFIIDFILFLNLVTIFPATYIVENICYNDACEEAIISYQELMLKMIKLYFFYRTIGRNYYKKLGLNNNSFNDVTLLKSFMCSLIPINEYYSFWLLLLLNNLNV